MLSPENRVIDIPDLNRFQIGDNVTAEECDDHDRFDGIVIGIYFQRLYGTNTLLPSITLLHDGDLITDGFKPSDLRKISD